MSTSKVKTRLHGQAYNNYSEQQLRQALEENYIELKDQDEKLASKDKEIETLTSQIKKSNFQEEALRFLKEVITGEGYEVDVKVLALKEYCLCLRNTYNKHY